jgi:hypothetical protein
MAVGGHDPFHYRSSLSFPDDAIITAVCPYPYSMIGFIKDDSFGCILLATSKGQVYVIDLDASSEEETLRVWNVFKTNPVSSAFHYSDRESEDGGLLFVGGEMSDTIVYWVHPF